MVGAARVHTYFRESRPKSSRCKPHATGYVTLTGNESGAVVERKTVADVVACIGSEAEAGYRPIRRGWSFGEPALKQEWLRQAFVASKRLLPASNWSKMERGVPPPPRDEAILERLAAFFGLTAKKKQEFLEVARLSRAELPADMASDDRALALLPAYLRAARGGVLEGDKLQQFIEDVRAVHSPAAEA